jgi:hypothetical protein
MDYFNIDIGNPFEGCSNSDFGGGGSSVSAISLPIDRSERISGAWNKTVAFFTKGLIGDTIRSKSYLLGRQITGEIAGKCLFGFLGSHIGKSIGSLAIPTFAASLAAIFVDDPNINKLGLSKTALATGIVATTIAMQILFSEYLEETGASVGSYIFGSIGGLVGEMVLAYSTEAPESSLKDYAIKYTMRKGTLMFMQNLIPYSGILGQVRDKILFYGMYNKDAITNAYNKAHFVMNALKDQDIAKVTQNLVKESGKASFFGASILIDFIPRFIRVGIRSFNKYTPLVQTSPKILIAQKNLRAAFGSSDTDSIKKAKKDLIVAIKKEMEKQFATIGMTDVITRSTFDHFLTPKLDKFDIAGIEEYLLGFAITDDINGAYSKALVEIHAKCFFAFAAVHFFNKNNQVPKECEVLFFENIVQVFMSHYTRVAPDSKAVEQISTALNAVVERGVRFVISAPTSTQESPFIEEEEVSFPTPSLTEAEKNRFRAVFAFIVSMFIAACRFFHNIFANDHSNPSRESTTQIITDSLREVYALVNDSNSTLLEETNEDIFSFDSGDFVFDFEKENPIITDKITEITNSEEEFFTPTESLEDLEILRESLDKDDKFEDGLETQPPEELFLDALDKLVF